ncbi:LytR/AlgR family response regulator transcription factor [Hydrocarboniclastica marina]|uniref:DNA-binding response regulator n=1 Tax=Hydrocarboniclastica marina TaxID=2259620 RepID=A0A4P7XJP7_9ALTE|nr:LytTR family DNA-binding domain-containing protein [Hydrocarboniclastica marina]MAL97219.1 DNA-binding response regulator [Alteromonadaceae bacterium]QCF27366.1 DNA-binding response regulator [Hydrocarboniclastica marina]
MVTKVIIADDEPLARRRLQRLVEAVPGYVVVATAEDGDALLNTVAQTPPDIVLLDIRMPGSDGLTAAAALANLSEPPAIIFCTAYDEYALEAFRHSAADYLLKPVRQEALAEALARTGKVNRVQRAALAQPATDITLAVKTHRGTELIDMRQVFFCEADQKYVTLVHQGGETLTDLTLKELEAAYPDSLLRIHRNTLVGQRYIKALVRDNSGHYFVQLHTTPRRLNVSRRHAASLKTWLEQQ